jgi:hypothetical protein
MLRTLLCAAAAACAIPTHAETWHFEYRGFHDSFAGTFLTDRTLTGSFAGQDGNGDGTMAIEEITSLVLDGFDYVACASQSNAYFQCGTEAFSFSRGALSFTAGLSSTDPEGWFVGGHLFIAGDREYQYNFRPGEVQEWEYRWTPQTTFAISSAPEPGTWMLLLAGIPMAALAARRRRRQRALHDTAGVR